MSIQSEMQRLNQAKANLKTAITGKGVIVPDSAKLDEFSSFVNEIQQGGSGGSSMDIYKCASVDSVNNTWSGYLYNTETKQFSDTLTEGLEYKMAAPVVGNCYTKDGMIECNVTAGEGLLVYVPLHERRDNAETGQVIRHTTGYSDEFYGEYTTYKGVKCLHLDDGMSYIRITPFSIEEESDWTILVMLNINKNSLSGSTNYCAISSGENADNSGTRIHTYPHNPLGVKVYADNINNPALGVYADYNSDVWYHYAIRNNSGLVEIYQNGIKLDISCELLFKFYNGLNIGSRYGQADYYHGYIAEVKVYRAAISATEIKAEADRCLAMVAE